VGQEGTTEANVPGQPTPADEVVDEIPGQPNQPVDKGPLRKSNKSDEGCYDDCFQ